MLNTGAYDLPEYEWGTASSPIIYKDLVIVQCDTQDESFVMASDVKTGKTVWKTIRKELPSWGTPTVFQPDAAARTGARDQRLEFHPRLRSRHRRRAVATWVAARRSPRRRRSSPRTSSSSPAVARPNGRSLRSSQAEAATSRRRETPSRARMSSGARPVAARTCRRRSSTATSFTCSATPGSSTPTIWRPAPEIYRQRLEHGGSGFSASPVASDGRIYLSSEDGDIFVVRSGRTFELLAKNPMGEPLMSTPALASGMMIVRGEKHLFAVGLRKCCVLNR